MQSEYDFHDADTSSGHATTARPLSSAERLGDGASIEAPIAPVALRERLRAARAALKRAETAKRVSADLVRHLEGQLASTQPPPYGSFQPD
jgi:hypothetical protein